jgi:hypothetical protein
MAPARPSLLELPPELIEEIIIVSTLLGDTRIAATLSQTCRSFRAIVYHQFHNHLWREMFLVVFDDPRPARDLRTHGRAPWNQPNLNVLNIKGKVKKCHDFLWEDEYKLRIWTEAFILRRTRPPRSGSPSPGDESPDLPSTDSELCAVLETLLRVISTAAPLPYDTLASMTCHGHACGPPHPHPVFSPLLVAAHRQPTIALGSHNTTWLMRVLAHGLPCVLIARLTAFDEDGEADIQKTPVKWDGLLAKLIAQIGLMTPVSSTPCSSGRPQHPVLVAPPIAVSGDADADAGGGGISSAALDAISIIEGETEADDHDETETRDSGNRNQVTRDISELSDDDDPDFVPQPEDEFASDESDEESESEIDGDEVLGTTATPATASQDGVRRMARVRVYNMAYLHPSRAFGPFLPLETPSISSSLTAQKLSSGGVEEEEEMGALESPPITAPPVPPIPDTNSYLIRLAWVEGSDINDDEYRPSFGDEHDLEERDRDMDGSSSSSSSSHEGGNNASTSSSARRTRPSEIPSDQLRFDWAWISAARQVIELNLRDLLVGRHQGVLRALLSPEGLRSCSAPGFPAAAPPEVPAVAAAAGGDDGCERERVFEDGQGWDWAGVEGQWRCVTRPLPPSLMTCSMLRLDDRRCICWLDYRDLLGASAHIPLISN